MNKGRSVTPSLEWAQDNYHGHPYWHKDFPGRGHVRIAKRNDDYVAEVVMVRGADGWDRQDAFWMNETFTTLQAAKDALDEYFKGRPKYLGAVTGKL